MAKLILSMDGLTLKEVTLTKERTTVGRKPHNDVQIDNLAVSGEHAVIVTILNDSFLEDLGSTNGTLVNGQPVKKHFLQHNDVVDLGKYRLKYVNEATGVSGRTVDFERTMVLDRAAAALPEAPSLTPTGNVHNSQLGHNPQTPYTPYPPYTPHTPHTPHTPNNSRNPYAPRAGASDTSPQYDNDGSALLRSLPLPDGGFGARGDGMRPSLSASAIGASGVGDTLGGMVGGAFNASASSAAGGMAGGTDVLETSGPVATLSALQAHQAQQAHPQQTSAQAQAANPRRMPESISGDPTLRIPILPDLGLTQSVQQAPPPLRSTLAPIVGRVGVIQILTGSNAGRELELVKALTTLGKPQVQVAVITKRPNGYFITHVEGANRPILNGQTLDNQAHPLADHDIIEIAGVKMEFYLKG